MLLGVIMAFGAQSAFAQNSGKQYVEIKTSAVCGMCKGTIETAVENVEGVKSASLDVETKVVSVKYDGDVTNLDAIKTAITKAGYSADEVPADNEAFQKLDPCCQAPHD